MRVYTTPPVTLPGTDQAHAAEVEALISTTKATEALKGRLFAALLRTGRRALVERRPQHPTTRARRRKARKAANTARKVGR